MTIPGERIIRRRRRRHPRHCHLLTDAWLVVAVLLVVVVITVTTTAGATNYAGDGAYDDAGNRQPKQGVWTEQEVSRHYPSYDITQAGERRSATYRHPRRSPPGAAAGQRPSPRSQQTSKHRRLPTTVDDERSFDGRLRADLMTNYDRNAFPWEYVWNMQAAGEEQQRPQNSTTVVNNGRMGLDVKLGLNFHKVHKLDVAQSTADVVAWVRIAWNDPRLRWDPADYGNLTKAWFWIEEGMGGNEASEIWTPDIYLWNQEEALHRTLEDTYARVDSNGDVFWSRPGRIKSTCKYQGLDKFPFDRLQCMMEFGSWARTGVYIRPSKLDGTGYSIGGSATAGQAFAEFELTDVVCEEVVYPPFLGVDEDWPVLVYELTFERASEPYVRGYVLLQILLNLCAFACLWIPPHVGERMGLAITSLLAAVASELTVSSRLPAAGEYTWFVVFSMISMLFSVAVVFESTAVIYFYYYTGADLAPSYVKWMRNKFECRWKKRTIETPINGSQTGAAAGGHDEVDVDVDATDHATNTGSKTPTSLNVNKKQNRHGKIETWQPDFALNDDSNHSVGSDRKRRSIAPISRLLNLDDSFRSLGKRDADDFDDEIARENNARWQKVSMLIDEYSRPLFIVGYSVFLAIVFAKRGKYPNDNAADYESAGQTPH